MHPEQLDRTTPAEPLESERRPRGRLIAFRVVVVLFAVFHLFMSPLPYLVLALFIEANPGGVSHQVHELSFGALFAITFVALLAQLRSPERKVAAMYQLIVPLYITIPLVLVVDRFLDPSIPIFLVMPLVLAVLHPARGRLLRPGWSPSLVLVLMASLVAVPLLLFAVDQIVTGARAASVGGDIMRDLPVDATERDIVDRLEEAGIRDARQIEILHSGHWAGMGAFALSIAALSLIGALRPRGWRLLVWSSAAALAVFGLASLRYTSDASALPGAWAAMALAWAILFVTLAERTEMDVSRGA